MFLQRNPPFPHRGPLSPGRNTPASAVRDAGAVVGPWSIRVLVTLAGLTLGGCAVGPDYRTPPLALPARYEHAARAQPNSAAAIDGWWKRFGDPVLDQLIADAVRGNLDVEQAKARVREARATRRQTAAALAPSVDGAASATHSRTSASGTGLNTSSNLYQAGFDTSWELDLFGANRRSLEAADRGREAADEDLRSTLLTLVGDVARNYVEARGYLARASLARRTAASQRATAELTRAKVQAGASSPVDLAKAVALAASTEANVPTLETSFSESAHRLGVLLGRAPGAVAGQLRRSSAIPAPRRSLPAGLPADVLSNRPDVRKAERQLAQATARIGQAEAALYPSVSFTGNLATSGVRVGDLGNASSLIWSLGPSVSVPVFDAGRRRAAVEVQQALRDQSYSAFHSAVLTALEDVENALVGLAQERVRMQSLGTATRNYREAARLARVRYSGGTSSFLDVLDAERSLYEAEDNLLQSRVVAASRFVALGKALGGGWSGPVDTDRPAIVDQDTGPRLATQP